ncbi:MAG: hypothetical protein E6R11_00455 [Rhodocyclaceae bacterium]|nr:MAG: hypothetical protein E6R11_00455 [Rhodocyclaceae bacterium]
MNDRERAEPVDHGHMPRRALVNSLWAIAGLGAASLVTSTLAGCGGSSSPAPGSPTPSPVTPPPPTSSGLPALGAQDLAFARHNIAVPGLSVILSTASSGSSLLACVGRGNVSAHAAPTDNRGNAFTPVGAARTYTNWPSSGTALYFCAGAAGGSGHAVSATKPSLDETTLSVVEVRGGGRLQDVRWSEVLAGLPLTSQSVVTTGPAVLVAWWWGDAGVDQDKTAVPDNGFTVIHSVLASGELVQCAVAVRRVDVAGSYNVTWSSTPLQGAQLWIAAVQAA